MIFLLACVAEGPSESADETAADSLSETAEEAAGETAGEGTEDADTVTLHLTLRVAQDVRVEGAKVSAGDFIGKTDADGELSVPLVAGEPYVLEATHEGHVTGYFHGQAPTTDFSRSIYFGTDKELSGLVGSVGAVYTDDTALLGVEVWRAERDDYGLTGATVSLDVDYTASLVFGEGDWPVAGSTVTKGGGKPVLFAGVTPGTVSVSIATPNDEQCTVMEGGELAPVVVSPGSITILPCLCE